jgi:hypothetical protein
MADLATGPAISCSSASGALGLHGLKAIYDRDSFPRISALLQVWDYLILNALLKADTKLDRSGEMRTAIVFAWSFLFDHRVSPLRHIPHLNTRHIVLQILGWMWALAFSIAVGSYTVFTVSLVGHAVLIGALAITVATYSVAAKRPSLFLTGSGRRPDGEHI